jgi:hypothetical protein
VYVYKLCQSKYFHNKRRKLIEYVERRIFGPKREKAGKDLHEEKVHNLFSTKYYKDDKNKTDEMGGNVARMRQNDNFCPKMC